jgi:hypothetical protein
MSPTERLEWIGNRTGFEHKATIAQILDYYEQFLERTHKSEDELVALFLDKERAKEFTANAYRVGDAVMQLLEKMGPGNALYRYLII